ncbi:hypothetical protein [Tumebacillus lipolyticus]|uniref:RDD domain-containing protein n=1 Tax=Tumebacillus lipolyticus TaxID=1280370 RepID=A0ABW4ZYH1_9BACL
MLVFLIFLTGWIAYPSVLRISFGFGWRTEGASSPVQRIIFSKGAGVHMVTFDFVFGVIAFFLVDFLLSLLVTGQSIHIVEQASAKV